VRMQTKSLMLGLMLVLFTGCSSFHRDWRAAATIPPQGIEGRWEGMWVSDSNKHNGKLRCLLIQQGQNKYEARFHAKYKKILSFGYTASFIGTMTNDVFHFSGTADLGALAGGIYRYNGTVSPTNFFSTYDSKYDDGTFSMRRPGQ
jgi:hypothetical protein